MSISLYEVSIPALSRGLSNMSAILDKGVTHARHSKLDLVNARLAPDMYTLAQQVQLACHHACPVEAFFS